jgi:hypothetical protein
MATANFDLVTDVITELYLPVNTNTFVLGVSKLDGTDVLAGTGDGMAWQAIQADLTQLDVTNGGAFSEGSIYQPEPGTAEIVLQSDNLDPMVNKNVRAGVPIRVKVLDDTLFAGYWYMFQGYVADVETTYTIEGKTTIRLTAFDVLKRLMNYRHATFNGSETFSHVRLQRAADPFGLTVDMGESTVLLGEVSSTNVLNGDIINDTLLARLSWFWFNSKDGQLESTKVGRPVGVPVDIHGNPLRQFSNVHSDAAEHYCFNDIVVIANDQDVTNSVTATCINYPSIEITKTDSDSVDIYGMLSTNVAINLTLDVDVIGWLDEFTQPNPLRSVARIGTDPVVNGTLKNIAQISIPDGISVNYERTNGTIAGNYLVARYNHSITVDTWQLTLDLWG